VRHATTRSFLLARASPPRAKLPTRLGLDLPSREGALDRPGASGEPKRRTRGVQQEETRKERPLRATNGFAPCIIDELEDYSTS